MSEIHDERAGLASGLMTPAHELGGAFGVSIFSAIALGAGGTSGAWLAEGYGAGSLAAVLIVAVLALIALLAIPTLGQSPPTRRQCAESGRITRLKKKDGFERGGAFSARDERRPLEAAKVK